MDFDHCSKVSNSLNNTDFSLYVLELYNVHNYKQLNLASKNLQEVSNLIDRAEKESFFHYSFMFYVIVIFFILFILYKCTYCYYKGCKTGQSKDTLNTQNSIVNNVISHCCRKKRVHPSQIQMSNLHQDVQCNLTSDEEEYTQNEMKLTNFHRSMTPDSGTTSKELTQKYR